MQQVILIGDSIRLGYQEYVRQALAGIAEIHAPTANGGDSNNVRAHLQEWMLDLEADLIHLNCGLHDLKKDFDTGRPQVDLTIYRANLAGIFDTLLRAGRRLVWATTTPVNEQWHHRRKGFDRFSADVDAYNAVAQEEAARREIPIDDLHAVITAAGRDRLLGEDGVHFGAAGYALLGEAVAACVRRDGSVA